MGSEVATAEIADITNLFAYALNQKLCLVIQLILSMGPPLGHGLNRYFVVHILRETYHGEVVRIVVLPASDGEHLS